MVLQIMAYTKNPFSFDEYKPLVKYFCKTSKPLNKLGERS